MSSVQLFAGWNFVVYPGRTQRAEEAFATILPWLTIVYYWDNAGYVWVPVVSDTIMIPYGCYSIEVTRDCVWEYGPDEYPPESVMLYGPRPNFVPYCGKEMLTSEALSPILPYLIGSVLYFDNKAKGWILVAYLYAGTWYFPVEMMIPNTVYQLYAIANCVWTFILPPPPPPVAEFANLKIVDYSLI